MINSFSVKGRDFFSGLKSLEGKEVYVDLSNGSNLIGTLLSYDNGMLCLQEKNRGVDSATIFSDKNITFLRVNTGDIVNKR